MTVMKNDREKGDGSSSVTIMFVILASVGAVASYGLVGILILISALYIIGSRNRL